MNRSGQDPFESLVEPAREGSRQQAFAVAMHDLPPALPPGHNLFDQVAAKAGRRAKVQRSAIALCVSVLVVAGGVGGTAHFWRSNDVQVVEVASAPVRCPATHPADTPKPKRKEAEKQLVPGQPSGAVICRYAGLDSKHPGSLISRKGLSGQTAVAFAKNLNAGRSASIDAISCPNDTGALDLMTFTYPSGPTVAVLIRRSGCHLASNGSVTRWTTGKLEGQLGDA